MYRKDFSRILRKDLPDGGEVVVQFRCPGNDEPPGLMVGFAVCDADGFVRTFDARLGAAASAAAGAGGSRVDRRIAKAVFSLFASSESAYPAGGVAVRGFGSIAFEEDWHARRNEHPPSREAVEVMMNDPSGPAADSPSWIRTDPGMLGMKAPAALAAISAETRLTDAAVRGTLRRGILDFPILATAVRLRSEIVRRLEDGRLDRSRIDARAMASAASEVYGTPVSARSFSALTAYDRWSATRREEELEFQLRVAALLPVSWMPTSQDEAKSFDHILLDVRHIVGRNAEPGDVARLLGHAGGRWSKLLLSFAPEGPTDGSSVLKARGALKDTEDFLDWLADNLAAPFVSFGRDDEASRRRTALALATDGGGLRSVFSKSKSWHEAPTTPTTRLVAAGDERWLPAIGEGMRATGDGVGIVELLSTNELAAEGDALEHCVGSGSFAERCFEGRIRILSIRRGGERLSTVELSFDGSGRPVVAQHRGRGNAQPCPSAATALAMLLEDVAKGRVPVRRPDAAAIPETTYDLGRAAPSDFRRWIRRDLSRLGWNGFSGAVHEIVSTTAPSAVRTSEPMDPEPPAPTF